MNVISKSKLKSNMLKIFSEIEKSGEEFIITDHNRPVLKIQPIKREKTVDEIFSDVQGKVTYIEDINTPTENEWNNL